MNIYIAGGFTVIQSRGEEKRLFLKFKKSGYDYRRLYSFYFKKIILKSGLLK